MHYIWWRTNCESSTWENLSLGAIQQWIFSCIRLLHLRVLPQAVSVSVLEHLCAGLYCKSGCSARHLPVPSGSRNMAWSRNNWLRSHGLPSLVVSYQTLFGQFIRVFIVALGLTLEDAVHNALTPMSFPYSPTDDIQGLESMIFTTSSH